MLTSEQVSLALSIGELGAENERIFYKLLEGTLTSEELKAMQIVVAFFKIKSNPHREAAMKKALAEQLYEEFNA